MKKIVKLISCLLFLGGTLSARENNLIVNGMFHADQADFPPFWVVTSSDPQLRFSRKGAPNGGGYLSLSSKFNRGIAVRQNGLKLCAGEKYRLGGFFRTKGIKGKSGCYVISRNWAAGVRLDKVPGDTNGKWVYAEQEITVPASKGLHDVILYLAPGDGLLEASDLKLFPQSAKARENSYSILEGGEPVLVPLGVLARIPSSDPRLECQWTGRTGTGTSALKVIYASGEWKNGRSAVLSGKRVMLDFSGLKTGPHSIEVNVVDSETGKNLYNTVFPIRIANSLQAPDTTRRLNNLTSELCSRKVESGESVAIVKPADGWLYFRFQAENAGGELYFKGEKIVGPETPRGEAFRFAESGKYKLDVRGMRGHLTIREIPEIFMFPCWSNPVVSGNGKYDWAFFKKYILGAVTTLNGYFMNPHEIAEAKQSGLLRLANFNIWRGQKNRNDADELVTLMRSSRGFVSDSYQGMTVDELFYSNPQDLDVYTKALKKLPNPADRLIYTWIVGFPSPAYCAFISAAVNASGGRGRLLWEAYLTDRNCNSEEEAKVYLKQTAGGFAAYRTISGTFQQNLSVIAGHFNQLPLISLNHNPAVDYKYFLDMQFHMLANAPEYKGLSGVGYWGTHVADEEIARWSYRLVRHYVIEGRKEMLSKSRGFRFRPEILRNGDFRDGLKYWMKKGAVRTDEHPGYGEMQGRWGGNQNQGDTFAILEPQSELSQKLANLEPGKLYSAVFIAVDYNDLKKSIRHPRKLPVSMKIDHAEVIPGKTYCYVDNTRKRRAQQDKVSLARVNFFRTVFRAEAPEAVLRIDSASAKPGTLTAVNFVSVKPYFEEEPFQ